MSTIYVGQGTVINECDETESLTSLQKLIDALKIVIQQCFPAIIAYGTQRAGIQMNSFVPPSIFVRLQWKGQYPRTKFTGALLQCYQLQDIYISVSVDWRTDRQLIALFNAHGVIME